MSKQETENSWLIDLILSFFHSPEWKAPVMSFIEEKCIVFDDEEENKLEYTIVHKEFKQLAEGLIEGMLSELGATPEMFGEAMEKAGNTPGFQRINKIIGTLNISKILPTNLAYTDIHEFFLISSIFETSRFNTYPEYLCHNFRFIDSIDNYQIFHKMMKKKNADLNQAAFKILQEGPPEIYSQTTTGVPTAVLPGEETKTETKTKTKDSSKSGKSKVDRKKELEDKKQLGRLNTIETNELTDLEKQQIQLAEQMSMQEQEDINSKSNSVTCLLFYIMSKLNSFML